VGHGLYLDHTTVVINGGSVGGASVEAIGEVRGEGRSRHI